MKGFTLIETLITISVFTLIIAGLFAFIIWGYKTQSFTWQQSMAIEEARKGVEIMTKELREAKTGEDGSYLLEKAGDKEIIFYSDIDKDDQIERVRYFLGTTNSGTIIKKCVTFTQGGSCSLSFSNFLKGTLKTAQVKVSVEGDLGASNEYVEIFADGAKLGDLCRSGCNDCAAAWQGTTVFDVTNYSQDNSIQFVADATSRVDPICNWEEANHAIKAIFEFSFTEEISGLAHEFRKGVINATGTPVGYPLNEETFSLVSSYVRNSPPIFEYFDGQGNKITDYPARLSDTRLIKVFLVINVNPNRPPQDFGLESAVQLRNLK